MTKQTNKKNKRKYCKMLKYTGIAFMVFFIICAFLYEREQQRQSIGDVIYQDSLIKVIHLGVSKEQVQDCEYKKAWSNYKEWEGRK